MKDRFIWSLGNFLLKCIFGLGAILAGNHIFKVSEENVTLFMFFVAIASICSGMTVILNAPNELDKWMKKKS